MREFVIDIEPDGKVTIEGKGFEGAECKALSKDIEAHLGDVQKVVEKAEFKRGRPMLRKVGA